MGTSVALLTARLRRAGRHDLLSAVATGELSTYAAAEAAGIVKRRPVSGRGSENQAKTRHWAVLRATGKAPPLAPPPNPEPPAQVKFSQSTRAIIAQLVEAGRADLVIAIVERRISPAVAARIAERSDRRRPTVDDRKPVQAQREEKKPEKAPVVVDVAALIA